MMAPFPVALCSLEAFISCYNLLNDITHYVEEESLERMAIQQ
jgi:hypothetical protein